VKRDAARRIAELRQQIGQADYNTTSSTARSFGRGLRQLMIEFAGARVSVSRFDYSGCATQHVSGEAGQCVWCRHSQGADAVADNAFSDEDVIAFDRRHSRALASSAPADLEYVAEPKLDGLAVTVIYRDGSWSARPRAATA